MNQFTLSANSYPFIKKVLDDLLYDNGMTAWRRNVVEMKTDIQQHQLDIIELELSKLDDDQIFDLACGNFDERMRASIPTEKFLDSMFNSLSGDMIYGGITIMMEQQ